MPLLRKLLHSSSARESLAWWREVFGQDFPAIHRFLEPCTGVSASTYPCPDDSAVSFHVRESAEGYRAFPTDECADDYDDLELGWKDVQAWEFNTTTFCEGLQVVLHLNDSTSAGCQGLSHVGSCTRSGTLRQVYTCLHSSESEILNSIVSLPNDSNIGCIIMGEPHPAVDAVLKSRNIGCTALSESFSINGDGLQGSCTRSCTRCAQSDLSNLELKSHIDTRFDTLGVEFADLKEENDRLKQNLASTITSIAGSVEPEYFLWIFTVLGAGSVSGASKLLDIPNSSFTAKLKQYAAKGGVYATLFSMIKARKGAGVKSIVGFDDTFVAHQPDTELGVEHIKDLLDGLESLNADNWIGVRDELIELVKEELL